MYNPMDIFVTAVLVVLWVLVVTVVALLKRREGRVLSAKESWKTMWRPSAWHPVILLWVYVALGIGGSILTAAISLAIILALLYYTGWVWQRYAAKV